MKFYSAAMRLTSIERVFETLDFNTVTGVAAAFSRATTSYGSYIDLSAPSTYLDLTAGTT